MKTRIVVKLEPLIDEIGDISNLALLIKCAVESAEDEGDRMSYSGALRLLSRLISDHVTAVVDLSEQLGEAQS